MQRPPLVGTEVDCVVIREGGVLLGEEVVVEGVGGGAGGGEVDGGDV